MAIFQNDGADAWAILHQVILRRLQGNQELTGVYIQPLQVAERADWDTPNRLLNMYREQRIANQVPTWNPIYIPNTGINVSDEYQAFLDQLNTRIISDSGVADPAKLKQLDTERSSIQTKLTLFENAVDKAWAQYVKDRNGKPPLSRSQWEVDNGYSGMKYAYQQELNAALAAYIREVNTAGGELLEVGRAISYMSDLRQRIPLPQDTDDATLPSESWQYWYRAGLLDDLQQFLSTTSTFDITLEEGKEKTDRFEERWSAGARVSYFGIFGASGSVSNETIKRATEQQTSKIEIHFENIQSFPVDRGQWFKPGLISRFRDRMPAGFWGQAGRLNLIPTSVILVRGVQVNVHTSTEVTDYFFNKISYGGSAGFRIGPWRIGGSGGREKIEEQYEAQRTSTGFTFKDNSGRAQVLAVASIRNADLLSTPVSFIPLYKELLSEQLNDGRRLVEEARGNQFTTLSEFGIKIKEDFDQKSKATSKS